MVNVTIYTIHTDPMGNIGFDPSSKMIPTSRRPSGKHRETVYRIQVHISVVNVQHMSVNVMFILGPRPLDVRQQGTRKISWKPIYNGFISCDNSMMMWNFISEHTNNNFQIVQRTLATPPFTLFTRHSTPDALGSTLHTYSHHFPLFTFHSTLYTLRFTLAKLHCRLYAITFTPHTLHPSFQFTFYIPRFITFVFFHNHDSGVCYHACGHSGSWVSSCIFFNKYIIYIYIVYTCHI